MTVQFDSPQGNTAAPQSSVWNQPQQDPLAIFNPAVEGPHEVATVTQRHVDAHGRRELATEIDGNPRNPRTPKPTKARTGHPTVLHNPGTPAQPTNTTKPTPQPNPH